MHDGPGVSFSDPSIADEINKAIDDVEAITGKEWIGRAYNGMSWNDTNWLHRGFTTTMITNGRTPLLPNSVHKEIAKLKTKYHTTHFELAQYIASHNDVIDYYELGDKREQLWPALHDALHRINSYIHVYESMFLRSGRAYELDKEPFTLDVDLDLKRVDGSLLYEVCEVEIHADQKDYAFNGYENNVYALKKILGKDYLTAYFEYDDPSKWDITNAMVTDGSFQIDYNNTYEYVYKSAGFKSWTEHYNISDPKIYSNFQIGRVTNIDFIDEIKSQQPNNESNVRSSTSKESETHYITPTWAVVNISEIR